MHTSPTPLSCALGIIHDADISELPAIKDAITASLLIDMKKHQRRPLTGNPDLDYVRGCVDDLIIKQVTEDRLRMLKRIVARQQNAGKPARGGVTEDMIERAKMKSIEEMIDTRIFKAKGKWVACAHCPLPEHGGERTPSFYIDKENKYKCFGCGGRGDAISFYMVAHQVNFIQAVKALTT